MSRSLKCSLGTGKCFVGCEFHGWLETIRGDESCGMPSAPITSIITLFLLAEMSVPTHMVPTGTYTPKRQRTAAHSVAVARLLSFLKLARKFEKAPWASSSFDINTGIFNRMVSAHLHLIVGDDGAKHERQQLLRILSARMKLEGCGNLVWVTNRQQGKTTTVGRFLALLATTSPAGGLLATVYSTSLDRARELVKSAKQYLYWYIQNGGDIMFERDCERSFVLRNKYTSNEVAARPKAVDSCRGDAPSAAFFDEVGFVDANFWYKFAFPLLQVTSRVFTLITTPPPPAGFFAQFVEQVKDRNAVGDHFFSLVNHSLACGECIKANEAERCCHRLYLVPPWKSLMRFTTMKALVPRGKRDTFAAEVFGVLGGKQVGYFSKPLVEAAMSRRTRVTHCDAIYIGVDPASHGKSDMGMCAISVNAHGLHTIVGLAAVNVARCEMSALCAVVKQFAGRIRVAFPDCRIVPIIEANNNEVAALSLLRAFGIVDMPFTRDRFKMYIADEIGVLTTRETKMAMIQQTYLAIMNGALSVHATPIVADRTAFEEKAIPSVSEELCTELSEQLVRFADRPDGSTSGKTYDGDNDDMAMSLMMAIYWRVCIVASNGR